MATSAIRPGGEAVFGVEVRVVDGQVAPGEDHLDLTARGGPDLVLYERDRLLIELGQRTAGVRELRDVVRRFPGTDEERRARAKLKELGVPVTASAANQ